MHDIHNYVHDSCRINHLYSSVATTIEITTTIEIIISIVVENAFQT